jgi:dTDP-4-dehydrorhamnose 3,5-epimerase
MPNQYDGESSSARTLPSIRPDIGRFPDNSSDFTKLPDMEIIQTPIEDLIILRPTPVRDERGYFSRTLDVQVLAEAGIDPTSFKQENQSRSYQGVRRGLHGRSGAGEAKLVRCANGAVLDVVVDARPGSATFGQVMTFLLDDQVCTQVYIPRGFLHGFQALTAVTDVVYRIDEFHAAKSDVTVQHDDPDLAIPWPAPAAIMSARDRETGISWAEYVRQLEGAKASSIAKPERSEQSRAAWDQERPIDPR